MKDKRCCGLIKKRKPLKSSAVFQKFASYLKHILNASKCGNQLSAL